MTNSDIETLEGTETIAFDQTRYQNNLEKHADAFKAVEDYNADKEGKG